MIISHMHACKYRIIYQRQLFRFSNLKFSFRKVATHVFYMKTEHNLMVLKYHKD